MSSMREGDDNKQTHARPSTTATLAALFEDHRRRGASIRHAFVQEYGGERRPGPLHLFVRDRRGSALQQYLLLHLVAGLSSPWDGRLYPAEVWSRALGRTNAGAEATTSRNWRWLCEQGLVRTEHERRMVRPFLMRDDGSGEEYARPAAGQFFSFPRQYFTSLWHTKLNVAETSALLVALSAARADEWFELRVGTVSGRVGISDDTLRRGLDGLRDHGLVKSQPVTVTEPLARYGVTTVSQYRLVDWLRPSQKGKDRG